jgi:hypothetical protein
MALPSAIAIDAEEAEVGTVAAAMTTVLATGTTEL